METGAVERVIMVKVVISGALGRMGKRITAFAEKDSEMEVAGRLEKKTDAGSGISVRLEDIKNEYDSIIEFTEPEATLERVKEAVKLKKGMVIGTTGISPEGIEAIKKASALIPVIFSPNMSTGVNIFFSLIERASLFLGKDYRVKVKEAHHIHKKDKPSGTAKKIISIIKEKTGSEDVPVESMREGEIVGDHDIVFESEVDTIKISHSAKTRDIFALGAIKAAKFLKGKKPGLYTMKDVLGL